MNGRFWKAMVEEPYQETEKVFKEVAKPAWNLLAHSRTLQSQVFEVFT